MTVSIEQHVEWIVDCLDDLRGQRLRDDRAHAAGRGGVEPARRRLRRTSRSTRPPTPGTWGPTCRASPGSSCPTSAASTPTGRPATRWSTRDYLGFTLAGPGRVAVPRRGDPPAPARRGHGARGHGRAGPAAARVDAGRGRPSVHAGRRAPIRPPGPAVGEIVDGVLPGAGGDLDYRLYRPAVAGARIRSSPTSTAAGGCSAAWTPTIPSAATCAPAPTPSSCRSTTGTRRRPGSRRRPTTPSPPCSGSPPTPRSSGGIAGPAGGRRLERGRQRRRRRLPAGPRRRWTGHPRTGAADAGDRRRHEPPVLRRERGRLRADRRR